MLLSGASPTLRVGRALSSKRCCHLRASSVNAVAAQERGRRAPREENVPGDFYVDTTCIDCDTCRWMVPETFGRANSQSAIHRQPETRDERKRALQALMACPTFSIHARNKQDGELSAAFSEMPLPVPGTENVFHLVMAAEASFGAAAYLIRRPEGNVMVESPRFDPKLLRRIQELGGVKYMFLTHKDDVGHHAKWADALGCQRILRHDECNTYQGTDKVELKLEGEGPWRLADGGEDVELIFTPGHSSGHVVLFLKSERVLFSGDHFGYNAFEQRGTMHRRYNQFSLEKQMESLAKLKALDFVHVLPGHGRPMSFKDKAAKNVYIDLTIQAETQEGAEAGAASRVFAEANAENPFQYRAVVAHA